MITRQNGTWEWTSTESTGTQRLGWVLSFTDKWLEVMCEVGTFWSVLVKSHVASQAFTGPQKGPNRLSTAQWQQLQGVLEWAEPTPELLGDAYLAGHFGI